MEIDGVRVIHGDCLDVLSTLADGSVDCVITDPPYNLGFKPKKRKKRSRDDTSYADHNLEYQSWCGAWYAELRRVCRGPIAISSGAINLAMWCRIDAPTWIMCWYKPASMGRSPLGVNNWEPIVVYGPVKCRGANDVIRAPILLDPLAEGHPCPKPSGWAKGLIESLSDPDWLILDCFAGSGTVLRSCLKSGRRSIGIEKESRYIPIIHRRLRDAAMPLFAGMGA